MTRPLSTQDLKGKGTIYFVPVGEQSNDYTLEQLAEWFRGKYELDIRVVPPLKLDGSTWNGDCDQHIAERMCDFVERSLPGLFADPDTFFIGFTNEEMYSAQYRSPRMWGLRRSNRVAVVSSFGFHNAWWYRFRREESNPEEVMKAVRRATMKDIGVMYYGLEVNSDPSSILADGNILDLDLAPDDFYQSDLDPETTDSGRSTGSCLNFVYSFKDAAMQTPKRLVGNCQKSTDRYGQRDASVETISVRLDTGKAQSTRTDFHLEDRIPITFARFVANYCQVELEFGFSGMNFYNQQLGGNYPDQRRLQLYFADGVSIPIKKDGWYPFFTKSSTWSFGPMNMPYGGARISWSDGPPEHFVLRRIDGITERYLPCASGPVPCFLFNIKDERDNELRFVRERDTGRLQKLTSPSGRWVQLMYNGKRISRASDSEGKSITYSYDRNGSLSSASVLNGETTMYRYNGRSLSTISVRHRSDTKEQVVWAADYNNDGRVSRIRISPELEYSLTYEDQKWRDSTLVKVSATKGETYTILVDRKNSETTVWRSDPEAPEKDRTERKLALANQAE